MEPSVLPRSGNLFPMVPHRHPRIGKLFRTDFRFAPSPRSAPASIKPHLAEEISGLASNLVHLSRIC